MGKSIQLLTINEDSPTTDISFDFEATPGYVGVERVEVVMLMHRMIHKGCGPLQHWLLIMLTRWFLLLIKNITCGF